MANYFVTGASGFLGSHLVPVLIGQGHHVCCLSRTRPAGHLTHPNMNWVTADLGDNAAYRKSLGEADYVLHLAGRLSARRRADYEQTNVAGTETLIRTCAAVGSRLRRFVYVSSIAAMGPKYDGSLLSELDPCRPESEYGVSKLEGERKVQRYAGALPVVILRPAFIYGPGDTRAASYLKTMLDPWSRSWRIAIKTISLCHVADVVQSCLQAAGGNISSGEVYLIAEAEIYTWASLKTMAINALAQLIAHGLVQVHQGGESYLEEIQRQEPHGSGLPYLYWGCNTRKAQVGLDFRTAFSARDQVRKEVESCIAAGFFSPHLQIQRERYDKKIAEPQR
jgi:nucleoside-diphosphate-sugar epimerase